MSKVKKTLSPQEQVAAILDRQDEWVTCIGKPFATSETLEGRDVFFAEFSRGIFFLKEYLWKNREAFTAEDHGNIQERITKQRQAIEERYAFLEKTLKRVIR